MHLIEVPVLIVGGGPVGLTASILLSQQGTRSIPRGCGARYGLEPDGAVLVRPDGYAGWRSRGGVDDPTRALSQVLDSILGLH